MDSWNSLWSPKEGENGIFRGKKHDLTSVDNNFITMKSNPLYQLPWSRKESILQQSYHYLETFSTFINDEIKTQYPECGLFLRPTQFLSPAL